MAGQKRTKAQREADLVRIAAWYCEGQYQHWMAEQLGVTRQQIGYDLREIERRWHESMLRDFDAAKAEQLARVDHLERVAYEAWERSTRTRTKTQRERIARRGEHEGEAPRGGQVKITQTEEQPVGDPRYLEQIRWCIAERSRLLGLYAPSKFAPTNPDGSEPYQGGGLAALLQGERDGPGPDGG